jgi:hypothetical protein
MRVAPLILAAMAAATLTACGTSEAPRERVRSGTAGSRGPVVIRPLFAADYKAMATTIYLNAVS